MKPTLKTLTLRDFIKLEEDIDIYDDVCEELGIAFCGPVKLTQEADNYFSDILDLNVDIFTDFQGYKTAVLKIDDPDEKVWTNRLKKALEFFEGAAGYISESQFDKWFILEWE